MANNWYTGNADNDAAAHHGWLIGHFVQPAESVRSSDDLEIKWGRHPAGDSRPEWATDEQRTTLVLLVSGRHRVHLSVGAALLKDPGDYVVWGPGIDHSWEAEQDSVVLTVRWPSLAH